MKTQYWKRVMCALAASAALIGGPGVALAADADSDGIDDSVESSGGAGISFGGRTYSPCSGTPTPGAARNDCVSPTSKDIFVYLVTKSGGGFLQENGLIAPEVLFQFITAASTATPKGLGVGVHVSRVDAAVPSASRGLVTTPPTSQKAVQITVDELPDYFVFGAADQGTPSATGNATVYPATIKSWVVTRGGTDAVWKKFIQRTFSHELSHLAALTALYDSRYGGNHYATGSGVVMDQSVVYNSNKKTFTIYDKYAAGDNPCLLRVNTANPVQCIGFAP
jgi:hypothetical protein